MGSLLSSYQQLIDMEEREFIHQRVPSLNGRCKHRPSILGSDGFLSSIFGRSLFSRKSSPSSAEPVVPNAKEDGKTTFGDQVYTEDVRACRKAFKPLLGEFHPSHRAQRLLSMAKDLGDRLLPAFDTPTSLPFSRINLKHGVEAKEPEETCAAATTSLTLEFTLLSQLTGNASYEHAARTSFMNTWARRVPSTGLLGNQIGVKHGYWMLPGTSSTGAGIDSFFEYAFKGAVLFDDDEYMNVWDDAYRSVLQHVRAPNGHLYRGVHVRHARPAGTLVDSLSAFWPGLQVIAGDVENAIKSHLLYWHLWQKHSAMPEGFDYVNKTVHWAGYPLRPEFIESTYWLYRATGDSFYLDVGKRILKDLEKRTKVRCGFAVLHNIQTGAKEDRMESFMLSETLKYLWLLFDESNPINHQVAGTIFTTEGHILRLPYKAGGSLRAESRAKRQSDFQNSQASCPAYKPFEIGGMRVGIKLRPDFDFSRTLVDMPLLERDYWNRWATCELPTASLHVSCLVRVFLFPCYLMTHHADGL